MAKRVETLFVDDLDNSEASKTVSFAVDGHSYEIDLSEPNAAKFYDSVAPFVEAARSVRFASAVTRRGKAAKPAKAKPSKPTSNGHGALALTPELRSEIRAWAQAHPMAAGTKVGDRGRLPEAVIAAYQAQLS